MSRFEQNPPAPENPFGSPHHDESDADFNATMLDQGHPLVPASVTPSMSALTSPSRVGMATLTGRHTTVLPQVGVDAGEVVFIDKNQERYESLSSLGEGGAGEVMLVKDNDLHRNVAMKRLKQQLQNKLQMARFIEEVKTVGQLEHPNIIPIHDVGLDDSGQHFFTMKYVQGETLEEIIKQLRAGNPEYHKKYTYERRTQVFIEILHAIHFAHSRGIIHRDIKPANIMIGEFGEVMVMDWGVAKRIRMSFDPNAEPLQDDTLELLQRQIDPTVEPPPEARAFQTAHGTLVGTPAYMSPEQVAGASARLDERSDIYSLCVLFYEFLNLRHYLEDKKTLEGILWGVIQDPPIDSEKLSHPAQGPVPRELCFFLRRGLQKVPEARFESVQSMIEELQGNLEGRVCVYCPSTFLKRGSQMAGHYLDNHRILGVVLFILLMGVLFAGFWQVGTLILRAVGLISA